MDNSIRVRWAGGERTYSPGTVVHLGRESTCEIALTNTNVSRRHAELEYTGSGWAVRDVGSAQGTWCNGTRSSLVPIQGVCSVSLGQPPKGEVIEFIVAGSDGTRVDVDAVGTQLPSMSPPSAGMGAGAFDSPGTVIVGDSPDRPGGRLREGALAGATVVTGDALNVECAGRSYSFQPGQVATIGRDEGCEVVSTNPTVSRRHAQLRHDGGGWLIEDQGSSSGTSVDGNRVTQMRLAGSVAAWLGSEETGERIVMVTSGTHKAPMGNRMGKNSARRGVGLVVAITAVMALLVAGVAVYLAVGSGPDDDDLAKQTVLIETTAKVDQGTIRIKGSGTIVDAEKGLILTNAHVANPEVEGLEPQLVDGVHVPNPDHIIISITPGLDKAAEPRFEGTVVAVDGYLDLAVVKIVKTVGGRFLESGDLDSLTQADLGNSDDVTTGDKISVFGFPGAAQSNAATLSTGVISGPVGDDKLHSNRAYLNIDARIGHGNSGGLAANEDGELIGVPTILRDDEVGSIRPINFALPLITAAQSGKDYKAPTR